jgi:fatty-acyl-CoA synthase
MTDSTVGVSASVRARRAALEARHPVWRKRTLSQALDAAAAEHPDRPLILGEGWSHSYADVRGWSQRLAAGLVALGVQAGEHVALVMATYPEFVALKFAIARAGAVAVPINFLLRPEELGYVLQQSDTVLLVTMDRFRGLDYLAALDELAPGWEGFAPGPEHLDPGWERAAGGGRFPRLRRVAVFSADSVDSANGTASRDDVLSLADLERLGSMGDATVIEELAGREASADAGANADVIYTSGTSGRPKGVMLTHDALLRSAYGSAWTRAFQDGRRILFALPLYHVFSYIEGLLAALFAGGTIIPQAAFDPVSTLRAVQEHHADEALFVPTMTLAVLDAAREDSYDVSSLRTVMSAAAPAPVRLWEAL